MKNSQTLIGAVLMGLLMFGFFYFNAKNKPAKNVPGKPTTEQAMETNKTTLATTTTDTAIATPTISAADSTPMAAMAFAQTGATTGKELVIENEKIRVVLNTKGGCVQRVELKKYKTWDKKPLVLFNETSQQMSYKFVTNGNVVVSTSDFIFEPLGEGFVVKGNEEKKIVLRLNANDGGYFEQIYTLKGDGYILGYTVNLVGLEKTIPANINDIELDWKSRLLTLEKSTETERRYAALYYKYAGSDVGHLDEDKDNVSEAFIAPVDWVSFKQQFFNATLFSKGLFNGKVDATFQNEKTDYVKNYAATLIMPYKTGVPNSYDMQWYFGPNHYNTLKATSPDFESIIKLSPDNWAFNWIKYVSKWFIIPTFNILDKVGMNYGLIILILTLLLKLILTPLTWKAIKSGAYMKILKPEIDALKEKYGDDQQKIGTEQMKIYQRAGVSPFGGCMPMLLQMPILMAMYYFFPTSIELRQQPFLWATDLSSYDAIITFKNAIPLFGNHISLFTILMTITSVIFAVYNQAQSGMTNTQPGMQYMPYIMPVMLMFMFNSFPAALTYYYLLQNVISTGQQWLIQKFFIDEKELLRKIEENKKKPVQKSGWMKKLEELQKQAEQERRRK